MYLPTFYKVTNELLVFKGKRYASWMAPVALWGK